MSESQGFALARELRESGLSLKDFCQERGLSTCRVRYWKDRLIRHEAKPRAPEGFVVLSAGNLGKTAPTARRENVSHDAIEVFVGERYVLRFPRGPGALAEILQVLKEQEA